MADEKGKSRDLQEIRGVKSPTKESRGEDFSSLKALLAKIEKQKEAKKK